MKRYILRFRGAGQKPAPDVARIRAVPQLRVVDEDSPRMMLVEAPEEGIRSLKPRIPQWAVSEETFVLLPDPREKIRCPS